ncbi:hypothetical protein NHJ13734_006958 [Beauveria thailandica]
MAPVDISTHPAPGVTIANNDDNITIAITTKPPSDDISIGQDTRALWYAAYARLREKHTEELVDFEEQACIVFRLLQRSSSSNAHSCSAVAGLHNLAPNTVLGAVHRWISEAIEEDDDEEEDEVRRALTSTMTMLRRNMQESPNAHLAWVAACLCIQPQKLVKDTQPTCEAPGLASIVPRIAFYDRLSQVISKVTRDEDQGPNRLREVLVDLYSAILEQLVVVLALDHAPRKTRRQQKQKIFAHPNVGVNSAILHPITALELSLGFHARDKTLEESIAELVCLRAPSPAIAGSDDQDACETANDTMTAEDRGGGGYGDNGDPDNDYSHRAYRDVSTANAFIEHNSRNHFIDSKIQKLLCVFPVKPPPLLPPSQLPCDGLQSVFRGLCRWALKQDAYQRWRKARRADDGDPNDRILWLHGPEGSSVTLLLHALAQAEIKNQAGKWDPEWPRCTVACASWDWSRDVNGTSVVSVLRDLIWTVLAYQPGLQEHLLKAAQATGRRPLVGTDNYSQALYSVLGTSCDFYAILALLCSIVGDPTFAPTCFIVDYRDDVWDDGDDDHIGDEAGGDESCKQGQDGPASTAQKRAWMLRDLMALVRTTCRLSGKVAWIVRSMSSLPPSSIGGCHVHAPEGPVLGKVMHEYIRALLQKRADSNYSPDIQEQLASELTGRAGGNVAWSTLAVDLVARARLPWNAIHVLQRLPDSSAGLVPLLDCIVRSNVSDNETDGDRALVDAALHTAALAFQPLTVPELAALAGLPATVDAVIFFNVLARPLLELRDVYDASGKAQKYVYFPSRAVLAAQRARLAKATAVPDLHADMVCRHLRQLALQYGDTGLGCQRCGSQLSVYMKLAWLRHLDHMGIGIGRTDDQSVMDSVTAEVSDFVAHNAGAWLRDLDALGVLDVVRRMLQDLLPSPREQGRLSPTQAALNILFTRILRLQETGMSVDDCNRFMHVAGCKNHDDDGKLPVLPQVPPMLPALDSSTRALIGTLDGHTYRVRHTLWAYDGRLIVSVSNDYELQCWDRSSCRIQHTADHKRLAHYTGLFLSPTDPSLIVAGDMRGISVSDLAAGLVNVDRKAYFEFMSEWQKPREGQEKQKDSAADELLKPFCTVRFAADGSNDVIVTWAADLDEPRELVLGMPGFVPKQVRPTAVGYESLPTVIKDALPKSECQDASVADNVGLAAVVHNDGNLHWAQSKFARVRYDSSERAFATWDERGHIMLHFVHERGEELEQEEQAEQGEDEEREPMKPSYRPLIRSHKLPHPLPSSRLLSFRLSSDRDEIILTFADTLSFYIHKLIEADADARNNAVCADNTSNISSPRNQPPHASGPFTSILFSHDNLRAATSSENGQVQLWSRPNRVTSESEASDASDAGLWRTMSGSPHFSTNWLCFSSDDTQLLACYGNGQTVVWDTETCERVAVLGEHGRWVRFATFSPGDALVATAPYGNKPIRLWDLKACRQLYQDTHRIGGDGNDGNKTTPTIEQTFVALVGAAKKTTGTVAFSPDGRFLATSGSFVHIWDISSDSTSNLVLPSRALMPCATLYCDDAATQDPENESQEGKNTERIDTDDENDDTKREDDDDDDDDDDADYDYDGLECRSLVFSPDSRSLFGFCNNGRLFVWKRTPDPHSLSSSSSPSSESWQARATVLADGFAIPGQDRPWAYQPRRLSISEGIDGRYLLHTEIGVWELPSLPAPVDAEIGLRPSMCHPCSVVDTCDHMAILWQNQVLTNLPLLYAPSHFYFFDHFLCDVHTVDEFTSDVIIGTRTGRVLCFRFRDEKTNTKATEEMNLS